MKIKKTPQRNRGTYKLFDEHGKLVAEYKPGVDGVTEVDIKNLHRLDDHEVYINAKEMKHPKWFQPIYDEWRKQFVAKFKEQHGREPFTDEIPGRHRVLESVDFLEESNEDYSVDKSALQAKISVTDEEDVPDTIMRLREIVSEMPEKWQRVYQLVCIDGVSKTAAAKLIGISDVRVGQLVKAINKRIADDDVLKKMFR